MDDIEKATQQVLSENEKSTQDTPSDKQERSNAGQREAHLYGTQGKEVRDEAFLVTFAPGDSENPKNWSKTMKWGVTAAISAMGFNRIMVSTVCPPQQIPCSSQIARQNFY